MYLVAAYVLFECIPRVQQYACIQPQRCPGTFNLNFTHRMYTFFRLTMAQRSFWHKIIMSFHYIRTLGKKYLIKYLHTIHHSLYGEEIFLEVYTFKSFLGRDILSVILNNNNNNNKEVYSYYNNDVYDYVSSLKSYSYINLLRLLWNIYKV